MKKKTRGKYFCLDLRDDITKKLLFNPVYVEQYLYVTALNNAIQQNPKKKKKNVAG
jgi:hypothetical protein